MKKKTKKNIVRSEMMLPGYEQLFNNEMRDGADWQLAGNVK